MGNEQALKIYQDLIQLTANACQKLTDRVDIHVYYSDFIPKVEDVWNWAFAKHLQSSNKDLGKRMKEAFKELFSLGYEQVVIIGSDCPYVSEELFQSALKLLITNDLVIGPALDGGFYLLGAKDHSHLAFNDIVWSTENVYAMLHSNVQSMNISVGLLPELEDIDNEAAYNRYLNSRTD